MSEGGGARFVWVWVDEEGRLNVAVTFVHEVEPAQLSGYALLINANSSRYGIWWLAREGKIVSQLLTD